MQGLYLLLHLLTRVAFKLDASYSFVVASCVMDLGLEVEASREARYGCSSSEGRARVDLIGRDCELEISEIFLMVDPGIWVPQYGIIAFMCTVTLHNMGVSAWSGFLRGLFGGLTNNIIYRSVSTTTSEGCPIDILGGLSI